jgi:glycosyltransferase involved in cell wall biosynthesis
VGIPFHVEKNYTGALDEVRNTQNKHHSDPSLILYEVLCLMKLGRYKEATQCAHDQVRDSTEKSLLLHMIYRQSEQHEMAKAALNNLLVSQERSVLPESFFKNGYDFYSLSPSISDNRRSSGSGVLVTVIMTVHKWNDAFPLAVNSILDQSHTELELIIVDDYSPEEDRIQYESFLTDERIKRIRMEKNSGTYACRNRGIESALGKYVTFADSDDWNHPDRISNNISIIEERDVDLVMGRFVRIDKRGKFQFNGSKISQFCLVGVFIRKKVIDEKHLRFDGRARFSADSEFFERVSILLGSDRVYRHSGIDILALHHDDSLTGGGADAIDWMGPGETRLKYVSGYRRTHNKLVANNEFNFNDFPEPSPELIVNTPNILDSKLRSLLGLQKNEERFVETKSLSDEISVFMATYPGGFKTVSKAVNSMLNQTKKVNRIILHVNSKEPPKNLPNDSRIEVRLSESNDADNGKFKYMNEFQGYFLTVDDDISYPTDYVEKMLSYVDQFGRKSIIGVHGAVFPVGPPLTRWNEYRELRRTHTFTTANSSFTQVNCLGTGTVAFHSQIGIPNFERFDTLRMVDLHIAVWAQENNISMYSCPRGKNWLTEFEIEHQTRIWAQANNERKLQAQMIQTLNKIQDWKKFQILGLRMLNGPLSMLEGWENRQIPIGMKLPNQLEWKEMPETPKVTIYIPAYNTAQYIVECVNSALDQTYQNIEISIQNGGEADDTYAKLLSHFSSHENVIISSQLTTLGEGTNIAIAQGSGELILQLDSDDILHPRAVESLVKAIGKTNVCAYGNFSRIDKDGKTIDSGWEEPLYSRERLTRSMIIHHPRLFRRDAWELVGRHNEDLRNAEDYDFFLKLSEVGTMVHLRETLYSYRVLEGSASNFSSEVLTQNTHYVQNEMLNRNQLSYDLVVPNQNQPRNVLYRHIAYSSLEIKPSS